MDAVSSAGVASAGSAMAKRLRVGCSSRAAVPFKGLAASMPAAGLSFFPDCNGSRAGISFGSFVVMVICDSMVTIVVVCLYCTV